MRVGNAGGSVKPGGVAGVGLLPVFADQSRNEFRSFRTIVSRYGQGKSQVHWDHDAVRLHLTFLKRDSR